MFDGPHLHSQELKTSLSEKGMDEEYGEAQFH